MYPYFKDCVGAVDGTHIHIYVPDQDKAAWRNRKGFHSQNVFAACSFDLRFTFVYPGWEGSAHDASVVRDALIKNAWLPPKGRFYLADAGYTTSEHLIIPYNKTRYHLREQALASQKPKTKEELFNLRHAQLRNAIERIFGVLKRKFQILNKPAEFSIKVQIDLILALTGLFNYITDDQRANDEDFNDLNQYDTDDTASETIPYPLPSFSTVQLAAKEQMIRFRDTIATAMWDDYQNYIHTRY
jgi:hypothetical protein